MRASSRTGGRERRERGRERRERGRERRERGRERRERGRGEREEGSKNNTELTRFINGTAQHSIAHSCSQFCSAGCTATTVHSSQTGTCIRCEGAWDSGGTSPRVLNRGTR
jgi:hypothetical protein